MKAFTACVLISIVTLTTAIHKQYHSYNVTRDGYITLNVTIDNTTWLRYHLDKWHNLCTWADPSYKCHNNGSLTIHAFNITSGQYKAESVTNWYLRWGNYRHEINIFNITVIEHATTKAPTTANTATTTQPTTVPTTETTTHTTQLDTTVQNSTVLVRFLLREESTTEQTEATSSAFSSTANLTSLAWTNETGVSLMNRQPFSGLDIQITFLVVCGIFILVVLLYFVCCKAREKSRRPIYRPVIGEPQPLQVDGGLRNLLFSFTVW
ncbi:membrane glycoprotein E3 CR1-gamma [Human adenovirus 86]|nr:membrane glycoprotein E3 CR1-gamma [Human adenovirus 86]